MTLTHLIGDGESQSLSRTISGRRKTPNKRKKGRFMNLPFSSILRCSLLPLYLPLYLPFYKLLLPLLAIIESQNVRQDAAGNSLDLMLWYGGVID